MRASFTQFFFASLVPDLMLASPTSNLSSNIIAARSQTCKLDIIVIRTCGPDDSNLYARLRLEGPNQVLIHGTPELAAPGLAINSKDPLELKEWNMENILKVSGQHRGDFIQFSYGDLAWTSRTQDGPAQCRLVTDADWSKGGKSKCPADSRQFECVFPC